MVKQLKDFISFRCWNLHKNQMMTQRFYRFSCSTSILNSDYIQVKIQTPLLQAIWIGHFFASNLTKRLQNLFLELEVSSIGCRAKKVDTDHLLFGTRDQKQKSHTSKGHPSFFCNVQINSVFSTLGLAFLFSWLQSSDFQIASLFYW